MLILIKLTEFRSKDNIEISAVTLASFELKASWLTENQARKKMGKSYLWNNDSWNKMGGKFRIDFFVLFNWLSLIP